MNIDVDYGSIEEAAGVINQCFQELDDALQSASDAGEAAINAVGQGDIAEALSNNMIAINTSNFNAIKAKVQSLLNVSKSVASSYEAEKNSILTAINNFGSSNTSGQE